MATGCYSSLVGPLRCTTHAYADDAAPSHANALWMAGRCAVGVPPRLQLPMHKPPTAPALMPHPHASIRCIHGSSTADSRRDILVLFSFAFPPPLPLLYSTCTVRPATTDGAATRNTAPLRGRLPYHHLLPHLHCIFRCWRPWRDSGRCRAGDPSPPATPPPAKLPLPTTATPIAR